MAPSAGSEKLKEGPFEKMMAHGEYDTTRFAYARAGLCTQVGTLQEMLDTVTMHSRSERGMCFIENASPHVVKVLKSKYGIHNDFFVTHATNSTVLETWKSRQIEFQPAKDEWVSIQGIYIQTGLPSDVAIQQKDKKQYWHRDLLDERSKASSRYSNTTRISYCMLGETGWYLVLVDLNESRFPQEYVSQGRVRVRFPAFSLFSGGLQLLLHPSDDNLFETLLTCFAHLWTTAIMLGSSTLLPPDIFAYMLITSTNDDRLTRLRREIRRISFHAIRDAEIAITDSLHDAREELALVKDAITETGKYQPYTFTTVQGLQPRIESLAVDAEDLHKFFTETLQLIAQMNIIRDAQNSAKQARESLKQTAESLKQTKQAMLLTGLAAVYLPLSLATGIFGMNVREINDSSPRLWMFVIAVLVLIVLTLTGLLIAMLLQKKLDQSTRSTNESKVQAASGQSVVRIDSEMIVKPRKKVSTMKSILSGKSKQ